jgi:CheY-like chemotaxis protein/HPt (histidine-containing phosphotransfer) domain-containing protein
MTSDRRKAFEERLAQLKHQMEGGLAERAQTLREAAAALLGGDAEARRKLKSEGHKLRGIAGTYGHEDLTMLAARLEQKASIAPPASVAELARELADAAERTGRNSVPPPKPTVPPLARASVPMAVAPAPPSMPPAGSGGAAGAREHSGGAAGAREHSGGAAGAREHSGGAAGAREHSARAASVPPPGGSGRKRMHSERPTVRASGGSGALRVLAMDDEPMTRRLLTLTLRDVGGYDAVVVDSALEALAELARREFDVVISDAMMPDMSGKDFCIAARQRGGAAASLPIIILSAASEEELGWLRELPGAVTWLRKPFSPRGLVNDVARIVETHRQTRAR